MQQEASNRGTNFKGARSCELCRSLEELSHSFSCQLRGAGEAGGRGTQGPPQSPLPLRRAPGASGQISPTSCFLAPQWGWRDLKPLRGKLCHSQKSPLSASAALSPPHPLLTRGTEQPSLPLRPTFEAHAQAGLDGTIRTQTL